VAVVGNPDVGDATADVCVEADRGVEDRAVGA
jgi:hypothetical protein